MRAIVVSNEFLGEGDGLVGPAESDAADELADMYLHPALQGRVNGKKRGSVNLGDLVLSPLQLVTGGKFSKLLDFMQNGDPNAILTKGTTYARVENDLIKLAEQQKELIEDLIQQMANQQKELIEDLIQQMANANIPRDGNATEALIPEGDKLKGSKPGADPLSGIVGPTHAVYTKYKSQLNVIESGKFKKFFSQCSKNGCTRLHLFDLERARNHFTRHGGGTIEENVYVLHPKRDGVLVPILSYHKDLLAELHREFTVALGKLGAKSLTIETVAGMKFSAEADMKGSKKKKGAGRSGIGAKACKSITWHTSTYDPEHAMDGCSLVQDAFGDMTLLTQRMTSDVKEYTEQIEFDATFNLGIDVVKLINSKFSWEAKAQYKYVVEFFPRADSATRMGSEG